MAHTHNNLHNIIDAIKKSGLSIYDPIEIGDPELWIPTQTLELVLDKNLKGLSLDGLPIRTRSKVLKEHVCKSLGYPIPKSFRKTNPRFPGQIFDTYIQKANNLQIWNEKLSPTRRYVLIRLSSNNIIERVKVVTGDTLALLDTTGTLTRKYQARLDPGEKRAELISPIDTNNLLPLVSKKNHSLLTLNPTDNPQKGLIYPIGEIFNCLNKLIGSVFSDTGHDQERNRGAKLHRLVCEHLGYKNYMDDGRFPDIRNQLLEVKLQTSPTIDLGLILPNSIEALDVPKMQSHQIRHCDIRYALFYGNTDGKTVKLTHFFLTTGESFFSRFPQFQGKVLNQKIQIPLPRYFFVR